MNLIFSAVMVLTSAVLNIQELYLHLLCFFIHYPRSNPSPASTRPGLLLLPQCSPAAAVGCPAHVTVQRNSWPQGWNDKPRLLRVNASSSGGVLWWGVNRQTGPALLLYPSSTGPGAGRPGPPGAPGALHLSMLCPELLLGLCSLTDL